MAAPESSALLAIDAGQTAIKVRICPQDPERRGQDLTVPGVRTHVPIVPQLASVVTAARNNTDLRLTTVTAGVSGLVDGAADATALAGELSGTGVESVRLAHDSTTSYLGALGQRPGAVVAAGTGVVTLAVGAETTARVDGWGYLIGDAGSGYWIGREGLDAVMRAHDGRGPATALTEVVRQRWPDLPGAYIEIQADPAKVQIVSSYAKEIARLAAAGDQVCLDISTRAAGQLALSVITALNRTRSADHSSAVCAIGGVFGSAPLRSAFVEQLSKELPEVPVVDPAGHGIDGAVELARLSPGHPLSAMTWTAAVS